MSEQDSQSDSDSYITDEDEELKEIERRRKKDDRERRSKTSARASQHRTAKAKNQDINTVCVLLISERSNTKLVGSLPLAFLNLI